MPTDTLTPQDSLAIQDLIFRFMRSFDDKDWDAMKDCLVENPYCDYSSFRGTPASHLSREDYIQQRRSTLSDLKMQHNISNLTLVSRATSVEIQCNYAIFRFHPDFNGSRDHFFHSYGRYKFSVLSTTQGWVISEITQNLLTNDGALELHKGAQKK